MSWLFGSSGAARAEDDISSQSRFSAGRAHNTVQFYNDPHAGRLYCTCISSNLRMGGSTQ